MYKALHVVSIFEFVMNRHSQKDGKSAYLESDILYAKCEQLGVNTPDLQKIISILQQSKVIKPMTTKLGNPAYSVYVLRTLTNVVNEFAEKVSRLPPGGLHEAIIEILHHAALVCEKSMYDTTTISIEDLLAVSSEKEPTHSSLWEKIHIGLGRG